MQILDLFLQQLVNGIQTGSVYALIAVGYTMVYGVLKFINFAHGDVYMVGAYIGLFATTGIFLHSSPLLQGIGGITLSMIGCALLGVFIERLAYRPLRNGIGVRDTVPWSLFWSLYVGLFGGKVLQHSLHISAWEGFGLAALVGFVLIYPGVRFLFRLLQGKVRPSNSRLTALITAIGISLLLENQGEAIFGVNPQAHQIAGFNGGAKLGIGSLSVRISVGQLSVLVSAVILTIILVYIVRYTRIGRAIRAVSYDPEAAALMGIPTDRIIAFTFIIGSAMAGAAGFLNHMLTHLQFDTNIGITLGLKAFVAAVLGGIGSIEGAVLGAILMGIAETFTGGSSLSSFQQAVAFVILIGVLLFRPSGLLGRNTIEKV